MPGLMTYAIGDVHGCYTKLYNLIGHCRHHCGANTFKLILLGDYIDRGRRSRDVVNLLINTQAQAPGEVICLRGNHDELVVKAAGGANPLVWLNNGGEETLRSYKVTEAADIPSEHLEWLASLPLSHRDEKRFFVHAGVEPGVPLEEQTEAALLWIREPFLSDTRDHGRFIVHGHTPIEAGTPDLQRNRLDLDTGACFGGPLTAAVFDQRSAGPLAFIRDDGTITKAPALTALAEI